MLCCAGCGLLFYLSIQSLWLALFSGGSVTVTICGGGTSSSPHWHLVPACHHGSKDWCYLHHREGRLFQVDSS